MISKFKLSIVIITRNRANYLDEAIKNLLKQNYPKENFEIIVVDNNSSDNTRSVVKKLGDYSKNNIQYIFEPDIGMSKARNRGAAIARGEIVLFIDDDVIPSPHWLHDYCSIYDMFPEIDAAGGRIEPVFQSDKPKWVSDELLVALGQLNLSEKETILSFPDHPFGGNFSVKRETFMKVGGFIEEFTSCNEETAFFSKLHLNGYKVGYSPKVLVYHQIAGSRLSRIFFIKRGIKQGISNIKLISIFNPIRIPQFKEELNQLLLDGLIIIRNSLFFRNKYSFAQIYYLCIRWGQILGIIMRRFVKNEYRSYFNENETS